MPALDAFQQDAIDFMVAARGRVIYADPMGARKTGTTLSYLALGGGSALVVAPRSVHGHWFREATRFHPYAGHYLGTGTKVQRVASLARAVETMQEGLPALYVTTYESMKADEKSLAVAGFEAVVFDEGHRLKGRRTQVALAANAITKRAPKLIIATGTPILNRAAELWQYLHMLAPRVYPAFWAWAEEHFVITLRQYRGVPRPVRDIGKFKPGHEQIVRDQLAPYLIQREIGELFPGEPWVEEAEHVVVPVTLSPAERKHYDRLVDNGWTDFEVETISADNKLVLSTRLRQLGSDWGTLDETNPHGTKVTTAVELTADLVERGEQLVVFAAFKATVDRIVEGLRARKLKVGAFHGDIAPDAREHWRTQFEAGKLDVMVGTLASLGEGVDGLQYHGSSIVMVDRDWTPPRNDQAIGRRRRSGQAKRVVVYHVMAEDTLDQVVVAACLAKQNVIDLVANRPLKSAIYGVGIEIEGDS